MSARPGYWLFKSEPGEYSIRDLAAEPDRTTRWDGIRNYQARNYLRDEVALGDLVLFYHSGIRKPAIAGIAEVASAPYPDPTQFDPHSPGYDAKASRDRPRWYAVNVRHRDTLDPPLTLEELRRQQELEDMVLFRQGRLSIQPVNGEQWRRIMALAGVPETID